VRIYSHMFEWIRTYKLYSWTKWSGIRNAYL